MMKKPLSETNPHIKGNRAKLIQQIKRSSISSCGVEGIKIDPNDTTTLYIPSRRRKKTYRSE